MSARSEIMTPAAQVMLGERLTVTSVQFFWGSRA